MHRRQLVSPEAPDEAIEFFLRREDAEAFRAECLDDEPGWVDVLSVVPVELDDLDMSAT